MQAVINDVSQHDRSERSRLEWKRLSVAADESPIAAPQVAIQIDVLAHESKVPRITFAAHVEDGRDRVLPLIAESRIEHGQDFGGSDPVVKSPFDIGSTTKSPLNTIGPGEKMRARR